MGSYVPKYRYELFIEPIATPPAEAIELLVQRARYHPLGAENALRNGMGPLFGGLGQTRERVERSAAELEAAGLTCRVRETELLFPPLLEDWSNRFWSATFAQEGHVALPRLAEEKGLVEAYRLFLVPEFTGNSVVWIGVDTSGRLHGDSARGPQAWPTVTEAAERLGFWTAPYEQVNTTGLRGVIWMIEGWLPDRREFREDCCPGAGVVGDFGSVLLSVGLPGRIGRTAGEDG